MGQRAAGGELRTPAPSLLDLSSLLGVPATKPLLSINLAFISCSASPFPLASPLLCLQCSISYLRTVPACAIAEIPASVTSEGCFEPVSQRPVLVFIKGRRKIT